MPIRWSWAARRRTASSRPFGAAGDTIAVPPGGCLLLVHPGAGWTVTAATADLLRIVNGGAGNACPMTSVIAG